MKHAQCYIKGYPRPQFVRNNWINLNGKWDFKFLNDDITENDIFKLSNGFKSDLTINVPYAYNVLKSGINILDRHHAVAYQRTLNIEEFSSEKNEYILNFEGIDYLSYVFVNNKFVGKIQGGYHRHSLNVSSFLKNGQNSLVVVCLDYDEAYKPRGKQSWMNKPWGCWYLETTGIYKTVWLEKINKTSINYIHVTPIKNRDSLLFEYDVKNLKPGTTLEISVSLNNNLIAQAQLNLLNEHGTIELDIRNKYCGFKVPYWTTNDPIILDLSYNLRNKEDLVDEVKSYTAFKFLETKNNLIILNNNPIYLKMILFQGYYKDAGLTGSEEDYINVINLCKEIHLNGIRVHQKIEDELFYYYCDILGLMVFLEMPSAYEFNNEMISLITKEYIDIVNEFKNHPSIIAYVPINESWGLPHITTSKIEQNVAKSLYYLTKAMDPTRLCIDNDGWEHTDATDLISLHNYDQSPDSLKNFYSDTSKIKEDFNKLNYNQFRLTFASNNTYQNQPIIVDEFIGTSFSNADGWGYGSTVKDKEEYIARIRDLIKAIESNEDIAGFCITQFNDTYQETNGLFDQNLEPKVNINEFKKII